MRIDEFLWMDRYLEKLEVKHAVMQYEVESIFHSLPLIRLVEKGHRPNENLYAAYGQSEAGRYLIVFFVYKRSNIALIISARDMTDRERRLYERK